MDALNLELLSGISARKRRIVLENRYVIMMTDDNKIHGYYIVNWYRPPKTFQGNTDIFPAVEVV